MESLKSALYALYDAAEGDLLDLIHLKYHKANKTAKKLQLLLTLPASQSSLLSTRNTTASSNRASDTSIVDTSPPSPPSSNGASDTSIANTSPPSPPYSSSDRASDVLAVDAPPANANVTKCLKSLRTLVCSKVKEFTSQEVQDAVGRPPHEVQDYRLFDISYGTDLHTNTDQARLRATLAQRSWALGFEQWELANFKGELPRVQKIVEDLRTARNKKANRGRTFLRALGITGDNLDASSIALNRGIKELVIERLLKKLVFKRPLKKLTDNCEETDADIREGTDPEETDSEETHPEETSMDGIAVLSLFVYRDWYKVSYELIPILIQGLQVEFSKLLDLAKNATPWMKNAQLYYNNQINPSTKRKRYLQAFGREEVPASGSQLLTTTVPLADYTTSLRYPAPPEPRRKLVRCEGELANASRYKPSTLPSSSADPAHSHPYSQSFTVLPPGSLANLPTQVQTEHSSYSYGHPTPRVNEWRSICPGAGNGVLYRT
jgi:hypothetical protein